MPTVPSHCNTVGMLPVEMYHVIGKMTANRPELRSVNLRFFIDTWNLLSWTRTGFSSHRESGDCIRGRVTYCGGPDRPPTTNPPIPPPINPAAKPGPIAAPPLSRPAPMPPAMPVLIAPAHAPDAALPQSQAPAVMSISSIVNTCIIFSLIETRAINLEICLVTSRFFSPGTGGEA